MPKNRASRQPLRTAPKSEPSPSKEITFSIRLTPEEHERVVRAAGLRGWTPTNFIRTATLERAAHTLNTARVTRFNFRGLASKIADQLFSPRRYFLPRVPLGGDGPIWWEPVAPYDPDQPDSEALVKAEPDPLPTEMIGELREAARLGGSDFLNQIVDFCEGVAASRRADLPEPIDPTSTNI